MRAPVYKHELNHNGLTQRSDCVKNRDFCRSGVDDNFLRSGRVAPYDKANTAEKRSSISTWSTLISRYVQEGRAQDALDCYDWIQQEGLFPDARTYSCILKACAETQAAGRGGKIHDEIVKWGLLSDDVVLGNSLVDMYAKCGALAKAQQVLEDLSARNVVTWSTLIAGYVQEGQGEQALKCFDRMLQEGIAPDAVTFSCILRACGSVGRFDKGEKVHDEIVRRGLLGNNVVLGTTLVDMYVKFGALMKARQVLEELSARNSITWNALMAGYAQKGQGEQALNCFEKMQLEGLSPNAVTFTCVLKACGSIGAAHMGEKIHEEIVRQAFLEDDVAVGNALVDMYAKCGAVEKAGQVLEELPVRDIVSWSALIAGYAEQGQGEKALDASEQMQREGISPDALTFASILRAYGILGQAEKVEKIHHELVRQGLVGRSIILDNVIMEIYAKCGAFSKAEQIFEELPVQDVVAWSALIAVYAQEGQAKRALHCFERMQFEGLSPNEVTLSCILKACGSLGAADKGEKIHHEITRQGFLGHSVVLGGTLADMYAKCGSLLRAQQVLGELPLRDVVSWSALIAGYAEKGQAQLAMGFFEWMQHEGLSPDAAAFDCVLSACSLAGLIEDAQLYVTKMTTEYGMNPDANHYVSMVTLFARIGHIDRALKVTEKILSSGTTVWSALLAACQEWGDTNVGKWAFECALQGE